MIEGLKLRFLGQPGCGDKDKGQEGHHALEALCREIADGVTEGKNRPTQRQDLVSAARALCASDVWEADNGAPKAYLALTARALVRAMAVDEETAASATDVLFRPRRPIRHALSPRRLRAQELEAQGHLTQLKKCQTELRAVREELTAQKETLSQERKYFEMHRSDLQAQVKRATEALQASTKARQQQLCLSDAPQMLEVTCNQEHFSFPTERLAMYPNCLLRHYCNKDFAASSRDKQGRIKINLPTLSHRDLIWAELFLKNAMPSFLSLEQYQAVERVAQALVLPELLAEGQQRSEHGRMLKFVKPQMEAQRRTVVHGFTELMRAHRDFYGLLARGHKSEALRQALGQTERITDALSKENVLLEPEVLVELEAQTKALSRVLPGPQTNLEIYEAENGMLDFSTMQHYRINQHIDADQKRAHEKCFRAQSDLIEVIRNARLFVQQHPLVWQDLMAEPARI